MIDDSRSPLFSSSDFLALLTPHRPQLLLPDFNVKSFPEKIVPFFDINPVPWGYPFVDHCYGFKFEQTFTNSIYALIYRVLAVLTVPSPSKIPFGYDWLNNVEQMNYDPSIHVPEYLLNLKPHQIERIMKAMEVLKYTVSPPNSVDVFPKCDELVLKMKPRIIWNVPPFYQALLGPVTRLLTTHMKHVFDGKKFFRSKTHIFTLKFACGVVSSDLSLWFTENVALLLSAQISWAGIFLGDDTFILYLDNGQIKCIESDFSAFDSTQRLAVQQRTQVLYQLLGMPPHFSEYFLKVAHPKLTVRYGDKRQFKFKIKLPTPQTATGKPDTCVGNSLINIDATVNFMEGVPYSAYGFSAKIRRHDNFCFGTFLKGFWTLGFDGLYHWGYLPSLSIKLLKTFDFKPTDTLAAKLCNNLSSIGFCSTPPIRQLINRFSPTMVQSNTIYKVFSRDFPPIVEDKMWEFMVYKYGSDIRPLMQSLIHLLEITPLGSRLYHPLWKILADVDYGDGVRLEALLL